MALFRGELSEAAPSAKMAPAALLTPAARHPAALEPRDGRVAHSIRPGNIGQRLARSLSQTSRPPFGGIRWWFRCPRTYRRVRVLHLPLGGRHFWSRRAYRLAYASQRETIHDRAQRRAAKLCKRLGGDLADETYPEKPSRMRWSTYNRIMDELIAADRLSDEGVIIMAERLKLIGSD